MKYGLFVIIRLFSHYFTTYLNISDDCKILDTFFFFFHPFWKKLRDDKVVRLVVFDGQQQNMMQVYPIKM